MYLRNNIPSNLLNFLIILFILIFIILIVNMNTHTFILSSITSTSTKKPQEPTTTTTNKTNQNQPTIFCLIKTQPKHLLNNTTRVVFDVWAHKCDNYRFLSQLPHNIDAGNNNIVDYELDEPFRVLQPANLVNDTYDKLTDKIFKSIISIYKRRFDQDYDWFFVVDDDTYVNVANLRSFLAEHSRSRPITFGFEFKTLVTRGYLSGGSGYVMSREAFRRLGARLVANESFCANTGVEDVDTNECLRRLGVEIESSLDEMGRQRFLVLDLMSHVNGNFPDWLYEWSTHPLEKVYHLASHID